MHGVGVSVVNALSGNSFFKKIKREGKKYFIKFKNGDAISPLKQDGKSKENGTEINFLPSKDIFSSTKFSFSILEKRLRELAFLNKGIKITLNDLTVKKAKSLEFKYDGRILEFVEYLDSKRKFKNKNENELFKKPIYMEGSKNNLDIQCSLNGMADIAKMYCHLPTIFSKKMEVLIC